ncbi:MAG TPA: serine hydrolase [Gemmatimonadales bacterium]
MRLTLAALAALVLPAALPAQQADPRVARVDSVFATMDRTSGPGCAVGAVQDGAFLLRKGYGMADLESGTAITPETVFYMGSVSKQFTAMSIALLAKDGRLGLDDSARKWIPEIPAAGSGITIRHMVHHQSGLREKWDLFLLAGGREGDLVTQQDVLDLVRRQRDLSFAPGTDFLYNNTAYDLLATTVQRASGKSIRDFAAERIFQPLGMTSSQYVDSRGIVVPRRAQGYALTPNGVRLDMPNVETVGSGSVYSTVDDMAKWDESFYSGALGGQDLLRTVQTPLPLKSGATQTYAFGLMVGTWRGLRRVTHGGALAGFRTSIVRFPDQHFTAIVLCNFAQANPDAYAHRVADIYLADKLRPEPPRQMETGNATAARPAPTLTTKQLAAYAGRYTSPELDVTWTVAPKDSALVGTGARGAPLTFRAVAPDTFRVSGGPGLTGTAAFVRSRKGKVDALLLTLSRSRNIRFDRKE